MPEQRESAESGGTALAVVPRGTIVIVDDDSEVRTCHLAICERNGYGAHAFDNGHDALSFLGEQDVDIVLTDIRMPGMDGMELLDRILALNAEIPVIIMDDLPLLLEESRDGIDRIAGIVRNLKSFSRADGNEFVSADINAAMETALNLARNELKYVATLTTEYGDLPPTRCLINQLTQVFMNLLVNAAHAIQGRGEIRIRTWHGGDAIHVAISDTGCGIPEGIRDRIFEPFFTTKEIGTGTGLGLSICQDIIGKHNGRITVESSEGLGTTFTVSLPVVV